MRLAVYGSVSTILAISVVLSAMNQRSNFYAACIYLSKSSACMMILLNMGLIISVLFGKALQTIFFGRLRAIEIEHLYEKSWYAVTETCLAMTIFREEFDLQFIVVFTTLLFLKIFHWLCQDRVEYMEQSPTNRVIFHVRIVNLLALLLLIDSLLANHAINVTLTKGPNMMIMFGFEYTILICAILSIIGKYMLNVIEMRSDQAWEGKSMYVFYLDLVTDFFKLVTYLVFFLYICLNYQLPLHIVRDVYVTCRSFIQKCKDLYRYRRATRNMNELYPDATAEDLSRSSDSTCIICREEMVLVEEDEDHQEPAAYRDQQNSDVPKKLPCGHIFHFHCLRSWLERQQTCPTCRRSVLIDATSTTTTPLPPQQQQPPYNTPQHNHQQPPPPHPHPMYQQPPMYQQQQPYGTEQLSISQPNQAFNILTPSTTVLAGGLIPLVPLDQAVPTLPPTLTDQHLKILSTLTRESIELRLQLLQQANNQILEAMQTLTQALSVIPSVEEDQPNSTALDQSMPQANEEPSQQTKEENTTTTSGITTSLLELSDDEEESSSNTTKQHASNVFTTSLLELSDDEEEMSSRKKEKLPDHSAILEENDAY